VAADQRHAIFIYRLQTTAHDLAQDRRVDTFLRKARNGHRGYGRASHRPNIVDGIERRDATIIVRVVDDRSEEVERLDEREVVAQTVYARIVGRLETDNQVWVIGLFR
jgi:hypothetical protein